jgi:hypothetical protein
LTNAAEDAAAVEKGTRTLEARTVVVATTRRPCLRKARVICPQPVIRVDSRGRARFGSVRRD